MLWNDLFWGYINKICEPDKLFSVVDGSRVDSHQGQGYLFLRYIHTNSVSRPLLYGMGNVRVGRAIAQAVIRLLPTAAAQVLGQVRPCGICGG
jgi:hypothetical protein